MDIKEVEINKIKPYKNNAKKHPQEQVANIAESITQLGWRQPIVLDSNGVIIIGHGRFLAAKKLQLKTVPCHYAEDLTEEQAKKLRLLDNKLNESDWDVDFLKLDLEDLDFDGFDIDWGLEVGNGEETELDEYERKKQEFRARMEAGELSDDDEEYQDFLAKFEAKKTTDDCYTPPIVFEAVADYVAERYGVNKKDFVRPFYPGGDYQNEKYKSTDIVVDNPPFSIMAGILDFYNKRGIKFFLFAPHLTIFSSSSSSSSCLICGVTITYENGANVATSFVTNLESCAFRSAPKLYQAIKTANDENLKASRAELPKYSYPMSVITSSMLSPFSRLGIEFEVAREECSFIRQLDSQKKAGKALFGSGYLISDTKKAEREKAEREKAERWELSNRELEIIARLK